MRPPTDAKPLAGDDDPGGSAMAFVPQPLDRLPAWREVLAVVAHPDDESFGLGALLASFGGSGSRVSLLSLTHGEASTLHGVEGDLGAIRARELSDAAAALGIAQAALPPSRTADSRGSTSRSSSPRLPTSPATRGRTGSWRSTATG